MISERETEYWAVDLSEILDKLSLPNRVHNNSRKYVADELYSSVLPKQGKRIAVVVIRNTLHEMNIEQTARLLNSLHLYLKPESHIYVQEMSELRIPERGNAPWSRDLLEECLQKAGFNIWGFDLRSHSGILWYAIICQRRERETSYADCLESVVSSRKTQADRILTRLMQLTKSPQNSDELVALEHEYSCISVQLRAATPTSLPESHEPRLEAMRIPTRVPVEEHLEFVCPVASSVSSKTGLIAVISSKQLLDFPKLFASATTQLCFGGYSNRLLFQSDANLDALKAAMLAGTHIRVMVVDPSSEAARLRSIEPIYAHSDKFIAEIRETIHSAQSFFVEASNKVGREIATCRFELCASTRVPRWSYFIVDDTCYLSFYSIGLTGSAAPCFVYRALNDVNRNYFHVVQKEFSDLFSEAKNLLEDL